MSLEEAIITSCSPVLVGIKPANLFSVKQKNHPQLEDEVDKISTGFSERGIVLRQVNRCRDHSIIFVYRPEVLKEYIFEANTVVFLETLGYDTNKSLVEILNQLFDKIICEKEFPHEVGLFLGYPLEDIKGFVKHQGKNCKMFGYWKVYGDEHRAKALFTEYDKCKARLVSLYKQGVSINQLCSVS